MNPLHLNDWEDFEVAISKAGLSDAKSFYESYLIFNDILNKLPKQELVKRGWISSKDDLSSMVPLLQEIHSHRENALFRKSDTSHIALCVAWKSWVSTTAKMGVVSQDIAEFQGIDTNYLKEIAKLSIDVSSISSLPAILAKIGIVLVYERTLPRMKLDGVVFKLESGHPVIGISFRFSRLDNFWFTLMHELAHINLHMESLGDPIFDDLETDSEEMVEIQANRLAKDSFVERHLWRNCEPKYDKSDAAVIKFSKEIGIHPAIVAGMLQKELNEFHMFRKIVDEVDVRGKIFDDE
ncbi:MAG: ImmA/IrrE family metallo-endopeptidase [Planctomycetes bacterium]|nr:ImmA/IrrE family metallo-endopeptidase [Planctomycetota bacterium]